MLKSLKYTHSGWLVWFGFFPLPLFSTLFTVLLKGEVTCQMDILVKGEVSLRVDEKNSLRDNSGYRMVQFISEGNTCT